MSDHPDSVLVVGATGSVGCRVVATAQRYGLDVRAMVRDPARAERLLPGADLVRGDLEDPAGLDAVVRDVDAIVFTHGGNGSPDQARRIDYGGVAAVLRALDGRMARLALMTSIGVSRRGAHGGSTGQLLEWKRRSERLVRASGAPYTIVRPGWFDAVGPADERLVLEQTDTGNGGIGRASWPRCSSAACSPTPPRGGRSNCSPSGKEPDVLQEDLAGLAR
ncbi:MAG TPA: NAD(P)H-binding protein [Blastococcus sp.]|nr:NAD(P)H-binding protein [Blastococcus sp.]